MSVKMPDAAGQENEMRLAVGTFVEQFAQLEWFAHDWVVSLSTDKLLGRKAARQDFGRRAEILIELSRERIDRTLRDDWIALWKTALELVEHRNNIVHNPPAAHIYATLSGEPRESSYALHLYKSAKAGLPHYTTKQIQEYAEQARGLVHHTILFIEKWHTLKKGRSCERAG